MRGEVAWLRVQDDRKGAEGSDALAFDLPDFATGSKNLHDEHEGGERGRTGRRNEVMKKEKGVS